MGRRIEAATTVPFPGLFLRREGTGKGMSGACNNEGLLLYPWYPLIVMTFFDRRRLGYKGYTAMSTAT